MKRIFASAALFMVTASVLLLMSSPATAQGSITVTLNTFKSKFPQTLDFQLEAQSGAKITQVRLTAEFSGGASTVRIPEFTSDTKISTTYKWSVDSGYVPPGAAGNYYWTIRDEAGNELKTPPAPFRVDDPRREWKKLENPKLALYWYMGSDAFGKALFDRGVQAMTQLESDTGVVVDQQVQVFVYGDRADFLQALGPTASGKEGGVTFSEYANGIVLENISLSELEWGKGTTAHELTHVIMRKKIHSALGDVTFPLWLNEGLAVYYETYPGQLTPQFADPLRRAIQSDKLYTIRALSGYFNSTWEAGNLAYGESYSIVDFIIRHYKREKLAQLLMEIKLGGNFDDILIKVFGVDSDGLENEWRKDIGAKPRVIPTRSNVQPTAFPTFGLSTDLDPQPTRAAGAATATTPPVAVNATPIPAATTAPEGSTKTSPANPLSNLCGGVFGLLLFGVVAVSWQWRKGPKGH